MDRGCFPEIHCPHVHYGAEFGHSGSNGVGINLIGIPQKVGVLGPFPWVGGVTGPLETHLSEDRHYADFGRSMSNGIGV